LTVDFRNIPDNPFGRRRTEEHFVEFLEAAEADCTLAASIFTFGRVRFHDLKYLRQNIEVKGFEVISI